MGSTARRTGRAELDEHVQGVEAAEIDVGLRETERSREELLAELRSAFAGLPGTNVVIGQPISHRIDHMLSGTRANIAVKIIGELGWRLMHLENAVQNMGVRSLEARINAVLLELAQRYGTRTPEGVLLKLPLSREGLANYIGVARETVSRKLGALENEGVIRSINSKTLLIKDLSLLQDSEPVK